MAEHGSVIPKSRAEWRRWLQEHHASSRGVWLHLAKKHTGLATVSYNDAVEEALCFGWIDGLTHPVDDTYYRQMFTPRTRRSRWAATNKARAEKLIAAGLMTPAGMQVIELAKQTGTWDAFNEVDAGMIPDDLHKALRTTAGAKHAFEALTPGKRKQFLYYLNDAKKPETRANRIARVIEQLGPATTKNTKRPRARRPRTPRRSRAASG